MHRGLQELTTHKLKSWAGRREREVRHHRSKRYLSQCKRRTSGVYPGAEQGTDAEVGGMMINSGED